MKFRKFILLIFCFISVSVLSQTDSNKISQEDLIRQLDTLDLIIRDVFIKGNDKTDPDIITREMELKKGTKLTYKKLQNDNININRLGLFTKVDITPYPLDNNGVVIIVEVQEKFYILPLPKGGIEDGEWKKIWIGANITWANFRGRNESLGLSFRLFYNPAVSIHYFVPWISKKLHLFTNFNIEYSRRLNKSLTAVGKQSGGSTLTYDDTNYINYEFRSSITFGKYFSHYLNVYTVFAYDYLKVSEFAPGRTLSITGIDKYLTAGIGMSFDNKDQGEFATKGFYFNTSYLRYGLLQKVIDFGRFSIDAETYLPYYFSSDYYITLASKIHTSFANGAVIPFYNHEYLGYSEDYIRGWKKIAFEGENGFKLFNELRIPIVKPKYLRGKQIPIIKNISLLNDMYYKYGLYLTLFYDMGAVWEKNISINKVVFIKGTGIGLNVLLPFDYIVRFEWSARLAKPVTGQLGFSLNAKF